MNYIKLNLPPTICDLVKCQELIDSKIKPTQFGVKLMRKFWSELNNATYYKKLEQGI